MYRFHDLPDLCKTPAQTTKAFYVNLLPFHATKLVAKATSLNRVHQIFSHKNYFINSSNTTIHIEIRAPVVE